MAESKQGLIFSEFRNRCGYEITLEISNKLIGSGSKLFNIERYLSTYSEKFESLDLQHFRESLYGLRFLLDQWHEKRRFTSDEHNLFTLISRKPNVFLPLSESSDNMVVLISHTFNFSFDSSLLETLTPLHDWVRYYAIENIDHLMCGKWAFKSCLVERCENYVPVKKRFCGESCLSKHQKKRAHGNKSTFRSNTNKGTSSKNKPVVKRR